MKKILLLGNSELVVFGFRKEIVKALNDNGFDVYVTFPKGPFGSSTDYEKNIYVNILKQK